MHLISTRPEICSFETEDLLITSVLKSEFVLAGLDEGQDNSYGNVVSHALFHARPKIVASMIWTVRDMDLKVLTE